MIKIFLILISFFLLECSKATDKKKDSNPIPETWDMNSDWSNTDLSVKDL